MKKFILPLALVTSIGAVAEDEWVSVGANTAVAPAQTDVVVPAQTNPTNTSVIPESDDAATGGDLMSELLTQMEQMQQEIAMLRSLVETQQQQLATLEQEQQARYLDLDRRVASLITQPVIAQPEQTATEATSNPAVAPADAYKAAMTLVREKKFSEANQAFSAFTESYPQDKLVANAYYWNGEVYLVQNKLEQAKEAFEQVVTQFPDHTKTADASYKLGVTFHKLGDDALAREWLEKVIEHYPGKADGTVRLAQAYLKKLQ